LPRGENRRAAGWTGAAVLALGFVGLIVAGTLLLLLPAATAAGSSAPFSVALFTATSAVCVTGLGVVETGLYWSRFGQVIILLLIELGGVGFGAGATLLFWLIGRNISLNERRMLREIVPGTNLDQVVRTSLAIVGVSVAIQAVGALVLFLGWLPRYPAGEAAFLALFHAVSAFCNAGFDVFGAVGQPGVSMGAERHNPVTIVPIALLVLLGGLGFPVIGELAAWRPRRVRLQHPATGRLPQPRPALSLNARLVLVAHLGLFVLGIAIFWLLEFSNPRTFGGQNIGGQFLDAVNTSLYPRSVGFGSIPLNSFRATSLLLLLVLMFVGTASAGTGGGVKVNTVAALFAGAAGTVAGRPRPELFKRTLSQESINKALTVVLISGVVIVSATFMLALTDPALALNHALFEVISAFSTVGLTLDTTGRLSEPGRVIIELMMFIGRLGPLTLVVLLAARERAPRVTYAEEPVLIG
jgi:trk system potassium uptake protein TrkH